MSRILCAMLSLGVLLSLTAKAEINDPVNSVQRAAQERTVKLLNEIKRLKSPALAAHRPCGPVGRTCVQDCVSRYADGSCANYGSDYCGPDARCAPNCVSRYADGSCANYGSDFCGTDAQCSEDCVSRYADGTCANYGADVCY